MTLRVFLVEDSPTIRENLIPSLRELGQAEVVHCAAGEGAARAWLVTGAPWDLAVIDLFIKDGSGLGVLRALRAREPAQGVVVLSNYATADMRARSLALGADAVFDKSNELEAFFAFCIELDGARAK